MTNQEKIKEYLVGKKGYLKSEISDGKVIMLSGKWGSGKTHFWLNEIASEDLKDELKKDEKVYSYISLYGKSSIEEIENDIFSQSYYSAIGGENFVIKGFSTFTKRMKRFGSSKIANGLDEEQKDNIERIALKRLTNGGIICFDDFERKSKDIDLNDLFGFITQLTLNFNCKVVIILNDDVFEGKEKDIFSKVKEKTVSKFLKYEPEIEELFDLIFNDEKYQNLDKYRNIILKTIQETEELNARIYIQVLDTLLEWIEKTNEDEHLDKLLRCLILMNIVFILYHKVIITYEAMEHIFSENLSGYLKINNINNERLDYILKDIQDNPEYKSIDTLLDDLIFNVCDKSPEKTSPNRIEEDKKLLVDNKDSIYAVYILHKLNFNKNIDVNQLNKINNFIETGILI